MRLKSVIAICLTLLLFVSCAKRTKTDEIIYTNNFEANDLSKIEGGVVETFNGTKVLGRYNNGGFKLNLTNLSTHNLIEVSFDLYIHDSWDGNNIGDSQRNGPDIWRMLIDGNVYINTTFSNVDCGTDVTCNPQSYPLDYLNSNHNPRTGAVKIALPGACVYAGQSNGSSMYRITKLVRHTKSSVSIQCLDKLVQLNTADPKCDESWSVDNITVRQINL